MIEKKTRSRKPDVKFEKVVSIKDIGEQQTYDFVVPEHHNFVANGIVVHNSGGLEECSDLVFLMQQESQLDTKRFKNVLYVAKQRNGATGKVYLEFDAKHIRFLTHVEEGTTDGETVEVQG